jgi:formylglycine-generating enzyme required for sulfatase activity
MAARIPAVLALMGLALAAAPPPATLTEPLTGMPLVRIPAGRFTMGSPAGEAGRNSDETPHEETVAAFYLGRHEVTHEEWRAVMHTSPSAYADCDRCPVERVNYFDVETFLERLNAVPPPSQSRVRYRLPTEVEWEYACRAGTTTPFATGGNLTTAQANYNGRWPYRSFPAGEYRGHPTPVETFAPNAWGLFDMHGNVWEWTSDWYAGPQAPPHTKKVIRGGSWYFDANSARCALRYTHAPKDLGFSLGFRVAADFTPAR